MARQIVYRWPKILSIRSPPALVRPAGAGSAGAESAETNEIGLVAAGT
jgi:hypothetical protein